MRSSVAKRLGLSYRAGVGARSPPARRRGNTVVRIHQDYPLAPAAALTASGTFECTSISTYSHANQRTPTQAGEDAPSGKAHFHWGSARLSIPRGASPIRLRVPFPAENEERRKTRGPPDALGGPLGSVVYNEKYTYMSECTNLATAQ